MDTTLLLAAEEELREPDEDEGSYVDQERPSKTFSSERERRGSDPKKPSDFIQYITGPWAEDWIGLVLALGLFLTSTVLAYNGQSLKDYSHSIEWPVAAASSALGVVYLGHRAMRREQAMPTYGVMVLLAVVAQAVGFYEVLSTSGLSPAFWCILFGMFLRNQGYIPDPNILSGEYFVKVGVTLMAVNFNAVVAIGLPGLCVAWLDTAIVMALGFVFATRTMGIDQRSAVVVAGATSICGSSAATAITAAVQVSSKTPFIAVSMDRVSSVSEMGGVAVAERINAKTEQSCRSVIALMGILNTPLMPLMPLARIVGGVNPKVVGAWIGGSIDSTGQVIASASLGGSAVLEAATIIKMAQNIAIGPVCLILALYFNNSFEARILLDKFPLFVFGFFITSSVVTIIRSKGSDVVADLVTENSWVVAEWMNLVGFALIGCSLDFKKFLNSSRDRSILYSYMVIQTMDIFSTLGWAYLMFRNSAYSEDDDNNE